MPALPVGKTIGGWSLIELLISLATIAIILAAAGPNVSAWGEQYAYSHRCRVNQ